MNKNIKSFLILATLIIGITISPFVNNIINNKNTKVLISEKNDLKNNSYSSIQEKNLNNLNLLLNSKEVTVRGLLSDTIIQQNNGSMWNVGFNTNTMKLTVSGIDGDIVDANFTNEEFMEYQILNSNYKVLNTLIINGNDNIKIVSKLNEFSFNYGDILKLKGVQLSSNQILVNGKVTYNKFPILPYVGYGIKRSVYFKITPSGLIPIRGFQIMDGQTYYLNNNGLEELGWQTIDDKKYYFNNNGVMQTGWQTIDGNKYYFNSSGVMQNGWQTIDNKRYLFVTGQLQIGWQTRNNKDWYYCNPKTGVMETGWQTINGNEYYFDHGTGVMQTGFKKIDGYVYEFNSIGQLIGKVTIRINGATNETINLGEKFNPLQGITLNDVADPTAKIEVSGTVNTNVPGVYKLIYTVTDSYGQTTTITREITVKKVTGNIEQDYFEPYGLVINTNLNGMNFSKDSERNLLIENSNGKEISIKGVNVNWYNKDKSNYNGEQFIITPAKLSELGENLNAKLYITYMYNGILEKIQLNTNQELNGSLYCMPFSLTNINNQAILKAINDAKLNTSDVKIQYTQPYGLVINTANNFNNSILTMKDKIQLVVKNSKNEVIDIFNGVNVNWYSYGNYSGAQFIIVNSVLNKLKLMEVNGEKLIFDVKYDNIENLIDINLN